MTFGKILAKPGRRGHMRSWKLSKVQPRLAAFILLTELVAVMVVSAAMSTNDPLKKHLVGGLAKLAIDWWAALAVLAALCLAFQQISNHVERMRVRVADAAHVDMTSVWTFAGVILLPLPLAVLLGVSVPLALSRSKSRAGRPVYRQVFNGAVIALSCAAASVVSTYKLEFLNTRFHGFGVLVSVALAVLVYTGVNTLFVACAIYLATGELQLGTILGSWEENSLELATLCLGGLAALAMLEQPWLVLLVVPPMFMIQRAALIKNLEVAATTDAKTNLLNAGAWQQIALRELNRAQRENQQTVTFVIDMDNFKSTNDTYGHLMGDHVLKAVADCLREELRDYDALGRFGGEEFVALLADVDPVRAAAIADRILNRVRRLQVPNREAGKPAVVGLSASIGISCYPRDGIALDDLLHAADSAVYRAKQEGRDRLAFAGQPPEHKVDGLRH